MIFEIWRSCVQFFHAFDVFSIIELVIGKRYANDEFKSLGSFLRVHSFAKERS